MDVPAGVTQEEGHTGFLIHLLSAVHALIFLARRIQPFLSLVDREVSTRWAFLFLFSSFLVRKISFAGVELTSQRVRGLRGTSELPGRPCRQINEKINYCTDSVSGRIASTIRGCGKREAHKKGSMVTPEKAASVTGSTLRTTGLVPADFRQGRPSVRKLDLINSGLTQRRVAL